MPENRLTPDHYKDELIYRQIKIAEYADGQVKYAQSVISEMNEKIAKFCIKKELIETKGQYTVCQRYIKSVCIEYRKKLYGYFQKELKRFIIEQSKWVYSNSPITLKKVSVDKIYNDVFFLGFSDTDNIKSYFTRIFDQVFQLWNIQLSIAYKVKQPMAEMVLLVMGKEF